MFDSATPWTVAYQAPPSIGFSRQEYWSGLRYTVEVTNRLKGLDLTDRVPEELWTEVRDTVQRQRSRPSPRKRNIKRQNSCLKWPYKIAETRREAKGKGGKERYTHLNAEFQRI